ncbi:MAG: Flp pilus assembly protein CpaB [Dehalococcoidia bacterium]
MLLALLFGLVFAVLTYVFFSNVGGDDGGQITGPAQKVVVAKQDIAAGSRITAEMVQIKPLSKSVLLPNVFTKTEDAVGQVTTVPLVAGEQVISTRVSASGVDLTQFAEDPPLSVVISEGLRGVSIKVSEVAASGGLILPGDYVDVLMGFQPTSPEGAATSAAACYVLQDVQVLAISQDVTQPAQATGAGSGGASPLAGSDPNPGAASTTLAVTPVQAYKLTAAQDNVDQLWLSLRPFGDRGSVKGLPACKLQGS